MMQISELLKQHNLSDINAIDEKGNTALHLAVENEKFTPKETIKVLENLLDKGVDPSIKNKNRQTVLQLAVSMRAKDVVNCLIARKVKFDHWIAEYLVSAESKTFSKLLKDLSKMSDGEMEKEESESASFVEWMVSKGLALDDEKYCDGPCVLLLAIEENLQHIIPVLAKFSNNMDHIREDEPSSDSDYDHKENVKGTLLHLFLEQNYLARDYNRSEPKKTWYSNYSGRYAARIVKILLDKGVPTEFANGFGETALQVTVESKEDISIIELLVEHTKNVNHKNHEGKTAFYMAIYNWLNSKNPDIEYYSKVLRALIAKGADVNKPNKDGKSPLGNAVERSNLQLVEFLRDNGADFSVTPKNGQTLMHELVEEDLYEKKGNEAQLFDILVANGCPVNAKARKNSGNTPLHVVANDGNVEMIRKLVEHGARVNCKNRRGETPLHYVCEYNKYANAAELLLELGADVNAKSDEGDTPLHMVATGCRDSSKNVAMMKFLLEHGADMNKGFSVVRMALWKDYNEDSWGDDITDLHDLPDLTDCIENYASPEVKTLLKHWIKLNAANLKCRVDSDYEDLVELKVYKQFLKKCLKEVDALKKTFIDSRTTLYAFLHMDPTSRCAYIGNEKLRKLVNSTKLGKQLPEYSPLLLASYREAVKRRSLLEPVRKAWLELTKIPLPGICVNHIFSFLSNSDLFGFIEIN